MPQPGVYRLLEQRLEKIPHLVPARDRQVHAALRKFREELERDFVAAEIFTRGSKRNKCVPVVLFERLHHATRNIVPFHVQAYVEQEHLVREIHEGHAEHVVFHVPRNEKRRHGDKFQHEHRKYILERDKPAHHASVHNDPDIEYGVQDNHHVEYVVTPAVGRHVVARPALHHELDGLVVDVAIAHREREKQHKAAEHNQENAQHGENPQAADFRKRKEHEHRQERRAEVVYLVRKDGSVNRFREPQEPVTETADDDGDKRKEHIIVLLFAEKFQKDSEIHYR